MTTVGIIILVILILFVLYGVGIYNKLVSLKTLVEEAWSAINVALKKRHDLVPNLVETVKGYAQHESETLEKVIQARNQAIQANDVQRQEQAENTLARALGGVFALAERYPDLKANTNFLSLQEQLTQIENDIEKTRNYYNGTVREKNILIDRFPSNIVANIFKFTKSQFFELDNPAEKEVPQVKF